MRFLKHSVAVGVMVASLAVAGAASAAVNLVQNGGFRDGLTPAGGNFQTVGVSSGVIPGWDVLAGDVDWIKGYWESSDGDGYSVDMDGNTQGSIAQLITTVIGQRYNFTFDISGNPDAGQGTDNLAVFANAQLSPVATYSVGPANNRSNMLWSPRVYSFTATSTMTQIGFQSLNTDSCCFGAAIDNVSVTAVPEPGTWALMIVGFGGAGVLLRRRRQMIAA